MRNYVILLASLAGFSACATDRSFGTESSIEITQLESLPEPYGEITYTIGPQEKLEIVVVGAEDLSGFFFTDPNGHIAFPYLGTVETGGKSPSAASLIIAERLRGMVVRDPQVRVIPEKFPEPSITIGGEVTKPGSYPAVGKPTLMTLVAKAEGFAEYAKEDDVLIFRTVDGQRYVGLYDFEAISRGNYPDPRLYPNDVVMVGDAPGRRRFDELLDLAAPLATPIIILIDRVAR